MLCLLSLASFHGLRAQEGSDHPPTVPLTQAQAAEPSGPASAGGAPPMEFSDKPDFAIAGITDWTAVGGHGSDATLRTSEDLARQTAGIREPEKAGVSHAPLDPAQETALRARLAADPDSYAANHALGELYLNAMQYRQAAPLLERATLLHGGAAEDEYTSALACRGAGDAQKARQHVRKALLRKQDAASYLLDGELDEQLGDPLGAVEEEQKAAAIDASEESYYAWGSELLLHRAVWQAAEVFSTGAKLHPRSARLRSGLGAALFAGARYVEAAQHLCEASDLTPSDRQAYLVLGKVSLSSPEPLPCAQARLERFLTFRPDDAEANYFAAMLLLKQNHAADDVRATDLLTRSVRLDSTMAEAYLELGILASGRHLVPAAMAYFRQAIAADPHQAEAHYRLGVLEDRSGNTDEAKRELAVHEKLVKEQADAVEMERRQVKQFLIVLQKDAPAQLR